MRERYESGVKRPEGLGVFSRGKQMYIILDALKKKKIDEIKREKKLKTSARIGI